MPEPSLWGHTYINIYRIGVNNDYFFSLPSPVRIGDLCNTLSKTGRTASVQDRRYSRPGKALVQKILVTPTQAMFQNY